MRTALVNPARGYDALEDPALVALVGEGDAGALESLYARYGRVSYALALRMLGREDLARDTVRDVFLAVWRQAGRFDPARGAFSTWVLSATHDEAVGAVRREENPRGRRAPAELLDLGAHDGPGGPDEVWSALRRERVREALGSLPEAQREALGLAYFGGYTQREVAKLTDVPLGTVQDRMLAGMRRLRDELDMAADERRGS